MFPVRTTGPTFNPLTRVPGHAYPCGMVPHQECHEFIATWTYGHSGDCSTPDAAFKIGKTGTRTVALQVCREHTRFSLIKCLNVFHTRKYRKKFKGVKFREHTKTTDLQDGDSNRR